MRLNGEGGLTGILYGIMTVKLNETGLTPVPSREWHEFVSNIYNDISSDAHIDMTPRDETVCPVTIDAHIETPQSKFNHICHIF